MLCITNNCILPKSRWDKTQGVPSTSKSRGTCPPVHPRIYAHGKVTQRRCSSSGYVSLSRPLMRFMFLHYLIAHSMVIRYRMAHSDWLLYCRIITCNIVVVADIEDWCNSVRRPLTSPHPFTRHPSPLKVVYSDTTQLNSTSKCL